MTKKQHLSNIATVCGTKTRVQACEWFTRAVEIHKADSFVVAFWDYMTKVRTDL